MPQTYKHKETSVYLCNYHLIFCPKRRRKILVGVVRDRLEQIIRETALEIDCEVIALEIMPDHVHLLISAPPSLAPHQVVGRLKGKSARLFRQEFPLFKRMPSLWTRSCFCSTAGHVASETIQRYIGSQRKRD
ncbi:MAG: IS200/IS605 family transposase [Armatimonadetes bacterium]|nr:IS200/IS605 family transposase [Armatimonadota bacterium]